MGKPVKNFAYGATRALVTAIEYALIAALIAVVIITAVGDSRHPNRARRSRISRSALPARPRRGPSQAIRRMT